MWDGPQNAQNDTEGRLGGFLHRVSRGNRGLRNHKTSLSLVYLFMGSADSGKDTALIENCKVHGIDPEGYLVEVIETFRDPAARERAAELTPVAIAKAREPAQGSKTAPAKNYPAWSSPDRLVNIRTLTAKGASASNNPPTSSQKDP